MSVTPASLASTGVTRARYNRAMSAASPFSSNTVVATLAGAAVRAVITKKTTG